MCSEFCLSGVMYLADISKPVADGFINLSPRPE